MPLTQRGFRSAGLGLPYVRHPSGNRRNNNLLRIPLPLGAAHVVHSWGHPSTPILPSPLRETSHGSIVRRVAGAIVVLLILSAGAQGQGFDKQVLDQVKDATVFVKIKSGKTQLGSGSGFVIKGIADTVLIMTNRHVAVPDPAEMPKGAKIELSVVFRSGTPQEQELPARLVAFDDREDRDLAMLEVKGVNRVPRPIQAEQAAPESEFFETMPVYALGFPLGSRIQEVTDNRGTNPAITVTQMSISRLPRDAAGKLSLVQLSGAMIGGNSGGPVLDVKGRLIGVAVARINGESVGFAISPSIIAGFLGGDIGMPVVEVLPPQAGSAQLKVGVRLVDPLGKLKGVAVRFAPQSSSGPIQPDSRGFSRSCRAGRAWRSRWARAWPSAWWACPFPAPILARSSCNSS